jgi:RraA family protein
MANINFRIYTKNNRPSAELVKSFAQIPVANIGDCMNRRACMSARIKAMNTTPLLGPALTVKCTPGDNLLLYKAIDMVKPGDVIVLDAQGELSNAIIGELMLTWAKGKGLAGIVVDGAVRDAGAIKEMDIAVYAAGVTPNGPYKNGPGEINVPITCGGIVVNPGDIVVGDEDGIVVINPKEAPELLEKAHATMAKEAKIMEDIKNLAWDQTWVDDALKAKGCEFIEE